MKKILFGIFFAIAICMPFSAYSAEATSLSYTTLRSIDTGTFNEYRYKITEQFFILRDRWEINGELSKETLEDIGVLADKGYKYLPDNLQNKNYLKKLLTDLQRGVKFPNNDSNYTEIIKSISDYLDKVTIESIKGSVYVSPEEGNAPLNVTLRGDVTDPTGTQIPKYNYTWWIDDGGKSVVIGRGLSLNYTFREEGNFSVFLDVTSNHKNSEGNPDVLPFRSRADIEVKEKIASLIIKVNGDRLWNNDLLKFTPGESGYGLIFDATSSTPTGGAKFTRTEWDFGNGVERIYNGEPRIERVNYAREGDYTVTLKLRTNEGKIIEREFVVSIHDPIATINASQEDGFIGDKFTFSAKPSGNDRNLSYTWEVIDIDEDEIILRKNEKTFTYVFTKKGKFNVRLKVTEPSGETDIDTEIVYINSKAPVAEFHAKIPLSNKPNRVFLDGSRSFDPDFSDDGKLSYTWFIDGERVNLEDANANGSVGYYVFDTIGNHDISLEVRDPDNISAIAKDKIRIDSILSVEMFAFPRVIQRESFIRFVAESPEAEIFEWDFGDGNEKGGADETINHTFDKSGAFDVKLKVLDADNKSNTFTKTIYVGDSDSPVSIIDVTSDGNEILEYDANACGGEGGYLASRIHALRFDGTDSINIDGENTGLDYSWKVGNSKFATSSTVNHKFDEIGCFTVKLTVKSQDNGKTSTRQVNVDVTNQTPVLSVLDINIQNTESDPLVVTVDALGAKDPDGVIQSYLWYYYTDTDTEPQDFRASSKPQTTFVLPKITGQYYFVVILKDNNEARVTSEEVTGARFFTTVTGDNINTPLVELNINDSSIAIGDEAVFTSEVRDILGQDVAKNSKFSWDFDGDGFYDIETTDKNVTYKYKKSGTFYAKVKVKHKGISTTKSVTVNVSNKIIADFEYISIGNTFIFFDTSNGELDNRQWDLGDGTKVSGKTFVHEYSDGEPSHEVKLVVSEGTRTKDVTKKVTKNIKNILNARKGGLNLFTVPSLGEDGSVVLENEHEKFYIYTGESNGDIAAYAVDYDIDLDSDLNGGKDDDEDNKGTGSYTAGDVLEIPLNIAKKQSIRIFLLDVDGNVLESQDIEIMKEYIEEQVVDLDTIEFLNVSESEKEKIQRLKSLLGDLPQAQKLTAMSYIQRMQENWSDHTEKTRVIIEFETYLFDQDVENVDQLVELLESLLVEGQEDTSEKNVAFNALKNLIPQTIVCDIEGEYESCAQMLVAQLETIKDSNDVEANKLIGSGILKSIQDTDTMTNQQKIDFKAILSSLVYGGLDNIPEQEVQDVVDNNDEEGSGFLALLLSIIYWIGLFFAIFAGVIILYFIYYKLVNKDENVGFQDFIIEKTSFKKEKEVTQNTEEVLSDNALDILSDESGKEKDTQEDNSQKQEDSFVIPDPLAGNDVQTSEISLGDTPEEKKGEEAVPDWLAGNFEKEDKQENDNENQVLDVDDTVENSEKDLSIDNSFDLDQETKIDEEAIPDWLKQDMNSEKASDVQETETVNTVETPDILDASDTSSASEEKIPDWLAGDLSQGEEDMSGNKTADPIVGEDMDTKASDTSEEATPVNLDVDDNKKEITPVDSDTQVPDWLAGSFDDTEGEDDLELDDEDDDEPVKEKKEVKAAAKPQSQKTKKVSPTKKTATTKKKEETTKKDSAASKKTASKKKKATTTSQKKKTTTATKNTSSTKKDDTELWDDGMKVPDWLKTGDE